MAFCRKINEPLTRRNANLLESEKLMLTHWKLRLILPLLLFGTRGFAQEIVVESAKPGSVYDLGEKVGWHIQLKDGAGLEKVNYVLRKGNRTEIGKGELVLQNGAANLETKLDEPGTIMAEFSVAPQGKPVIKTLAGAAIALYKIAPSAEEPADFEAFWKSKVEELQAVPMNAQLDAKESGEANLDYWKISLDNIRGSKIRGQLSRPKNGEKLPALLIVQWAGVYPLQKGWATSWAKQGWLTLNINAHDLPIDESKEFYDAQNAGALNGYPGIGKDDREKSYFLRMYLSCYRAADYLSSRGDWDGKNLVVMGTSQGGLQAIMTGGFYPKISAVVANVPAGCDHTGPLVGRQGGWPQLLGWGNGPFDEKVVETSKYYDVVNFARRIKVPALVACGLIDTTCPPAGVMAALNQMKGPKELLIMEKSGHQDVNKSQAAYYSRSGAWLYDLAHGKAAPVQAKQ